MRTFDQLTQDEQMMAVDSAVNDLITMVVEGCIPNCFLGFVKEIDEVLDQTSFSDSMEDALRNRIESNQKMKVSMLHQAGMLAKSAYYADTNDVVIHL